MLCYVILYHIVFILYIHIEVIIRNLKELGLLAEVLMLRGMKCCRVGI